MLKHKIQTFLQHSEKLLENCVYFIGEFESLITDTEVNRNQCLYDRNSFFACSRRRFSGESFEYLLRGYSKHFGLEVTFVTMSFEMLITDA